MKKIFGAVLAISMVAVWAGGCQEEQASSSDKMVRLEAVENRDLQSQLQAEKKKKDDEIKNLNTQSQTEMKKKDDDIKKLNEQLKKAQALTQTQTSAQASLTQAEIAKRDDQIKELNAKLQAQMKKCDEDVRSVSKQLEQCENTRDERVAKEIDKQCEETVSSLMDWTVELTAEIEQLKADKEGVKKEEEK
jgi:cytochrome c553